MAHAAALVPAFSRGAGGFLKNRYLKFEEFQREFLLGAHRVGSSAGAALRQQWHSENVLLP